MGLRDFRPVCPRCNDRLRSNARRCESCGALSGLIPVRAPRRHKTPPPAPRPAEVPNLPPTSTRYIVRETQGFRVNFPIKKPPTTAVPGIECVVLDTAWNHRVVASFPSEAEPQIFGRAAMHRRAREHAATRCDLLNRLDEIAREAQGAVA